jgi:hypothetical protein
MACSLPMSHTDRILCALLAVCALSGCDVSTAPAAPPALSPEAVFTRDAPAEQVFQGRLAGAPAHFLVHDCEVFQVEYRAGREVRWTSVLKPDPYPFWTSCERQSLSFDGTALTATLGRRAFGAGGCCATGGTYRTVDGRSWKKV